MSFNDLDNPQHIAHVQSTFKRKQFIACFLCILVFVSSQLDFKTSDLVKKMASAKEDQQAITQVVYLTTAIFLILLGSLLEYSSKADLVVYMTSFLIAVIKILGGVFILMTNKEVD